MQIESNVHRIKIVTEGTLRYDNNSRDLKYKG